MKSNQKSAYIVTLTTDPDLLPTSNLLKTYFTSTLCRNISYIKDNHIEYDRLINDDPIHVTFREIKPKEESYAAIRTKVDCFVLLTNIECNGALSAIDFLITFLKDNSLDCRIYLLGFYKEACNVVVKMKEENLTPFLDGKAIDYDYIDVKVEDEDSQTKIVDFITQEIVQKKRKGTIGKGDTKHSELNVDYDKSKSDGCFVI